MIHLDDEAMPVLALALVSDDDPVVVDFASLEQAAVFVQALAGAVHKTARLQEWFGEIESRGEREEAFALEAKFLSPEEAEES